MPEPIACKNPLEVDHAQLYKALISQLTDSAVFLMDRDGCIVSWNPGVERILGYSQQEWLGQSSDIIFTPEDRALRKPQQELSQAAQQGQASGVRWHLRQNGSRLFVECTLAALRDEAGQLVGFSRVIRDITGHNEREAQFQRVLALAESEKQCRRMMNAAPAIISYVDCNLRYRLANDAYKRWFGISPSDLIGKTVSDLFDDTTFTKLRPHLQKVLRGETVAFEENYPSGPAKHRRLQVTYTPDWNERGEVQGFMVLGSDITARKKVEEALRQSEERWRSLFERMAEGFFVGEILYGDTGAVCDFRFVEVNPAFERMTGLAGAAGKTVREVIPGIQDDLIATYAHVVRTGEPAHFEIHVPVLGNRWYEVRARHAESDRFAVLFLDITERKGAELRLRESERRQTALVTLGDRLRDLKDTASLTSAAMEVAGTTLGVARAGYGNVDAAEESVTIENDWTNGRVPTLAGTYRFQDFGEELGHYLRRGELVAVPDVSTHPITAKESKRWEALSIRAVVNVPLVQNGRLVAFLFIQDSVPRAWTEADLAFIREVVDRTWAAVERARALQELQASEEFTRSVLASSPDCVKVLDLDGRLLTINEGGCRQMEIGDLASCLHQPWADFWGETKAMAEQAFIEARGGKTAHFEGFCPTAKGTPKWWEVVVTPIRDASGKPVRILSLSRDITERHRAEQERERLTSELTRSNEELSQFAHTVAHDLQSPLRGVTSFAQLLHRKSQGGLAAKEREFLDHIIASAHRMQELVEALLRFAQVGQGEIEKRPVEMDRTVDAALQSLQVQIEEQGARITRSALPVVKGDSVQLVQLLQNLLSNAFKYCRPNEPPDIRITATKERSHYVFAIADNGEGIAPEHLHRIFEPLKRLHGTDVPGTGLGLATCQRIVNRHGGRIWVESQPGIGSTFYFTLPGE